MDINALKTITRDIKTLAERTDVTIIERIDMLNVISNFLDENTESLDMVPKVWGDWLNKTFIVPLWDEKFWKAVSSKECYMHCKYVRRFFPVTDSEDWTAVATDVYKQHYPEFDGEIKPSNHVNDKNIRIHTNYGMIPQFNINTTKTKRAVVHTVIHIVRLIGDNDMITKLWYYIATNYELCDMVLKSEVEFTISVFERERNLVLSALFYTNYILAHEESTCSDPTDESRWIFTLDEVNRLDFLNNIAVDINPWIVNTMRNDGNIYTFMPFFMNSKRSVATKDIAIERLRYLTMGCLDGLEKFTDIAVTGSTLTECVSNNNLMKVIPEHGADNGINVMAIRDVGQWDDVDPNDFEGFVHRSKLYYPTEGEMASDIDLAISRKGYKEFIRVANEIIEIMNRNMESKGGKFTVVEDCTSSGVRFHLSHPVMKRKIEIFRTPSSLTKLVSGFHVPCVRMKYDFHDFKLTRGCVASLVTGVNENFNWFSSNKVPADVVLKYAQRGFSTILNVKELDCISEYMQISERWKYGFYSVREITGSFTCDNPFFRVDAIPRGVRLGLKANPVYVGSYKQNKYTLSGDLTYKNTPLKRYMEKDSIFTVSAPLALFGH